MSKRKPGTDIYERVEDRAKRGEYTLAVPIDYMILSMLPEQGELFAELYPLGETVTNIRTKFSPEQQKALETKTIAARLRVLHLQDLAAPIYSGNSMRGKQVWQRSPKATELVNEWKRETNGTDGG